jgi:hypothetical protein
MMDHDGNITLDPNKHFGRKTRYKLTRPDRCVFVDETGCNPNMKDERNYTASNLEKWQATICFA